MNDRCYAAIHLLQPTSGLDWLDDMIRARMRDEFAERVLQGIASTPRYRKMRSEDVAEECSFMAYAMVKDLLDRPAP